MPATAGPTMRAILNMVELSAMAFIRSSLPTVSATKTWRADISNESEQPSTNAISATCQTCTAPDQVSAARMKASVMAMVCVEMMSLRLLTRSAITPPGRANIRIGIVWLKLTRPSASGEPVKR